MGAIHVVSFEYIRYLAMRKRNIFMIVRIMPMGKFGEKSPIRKQEMIYMMVLITSRYFFIIFVLR